MMRALILSSRCTAEQRLALMELRAFLEEYGDTCEMLDWLSFLSDTVSEINRSIPIQFTQRRGTEGKRRPPADRNQREGTRPLHLRRRL